MMEVFRLRWSVSGSSMHAPKRDIEVQQGTSTGCCEEDGIHKQMSSIPHLKERELKVESTKWQMMIRSRPACALRLFKDP